MRSTSSIPFAETMSVRGAIGWAICLLLLLAPVVLGVRAASAKDEGQTHTVVIENMKFSPGTLRVRPGDRVVFENKDLVPHTATAKPAGAFDSGLVAAGKSWTFIPQSAGTFHYACLFHPTMEGEVVVEP